VSVEFSVLKWSVQLRVRAFELLITGRIAPEIAR